jgi:hypothetical protein
MTGRGGERREEKIMPSLMATSLRWRTHSARTNNKIKQLLAFEQFSVTNPQFKQPKPTVRYTAAEI